jgi:flagellar basal-body rod modification protein FlgD
MEVDKMVNSIGSTASSTAATTLSAADYMKKSTGLNKDDFMKLFITQLQNQDPMNPQDSSAMVTQITQVEQSYNTNTNLQNLLNAANSSSSMSAVSFIGKTISAQGSQVNLAQGSQPQLSFNLPSAANQLQVAIQDANGRTVRTVTMGKTPAGDGSLVWDGKDNNNSPLSAGLYSFSVIGVNQDGSSFSGTPLIKAVVDGVKLDQGSTVLTAGGINVPLASVMTVRGQ